MTMIDDSIRLEIDQYEAIAGPSEVSSGHRVSNVPSRNICVDADVTMLRGLAGPVVSGRRGARRRARAGVMLGGLARDRWRRRRRG